jgi:hypothetical protein
LYEHVQIEKGESDGMETEVRYTPKWKCSAVWLEQKPTPRQMQLAEEAAAEKGGKNRETKVVDLSSCEYGCGRMAKFLDRGTGIIMAKKDKRDRPVLFKLTDLVIDGHQMTQEDRLSAVLKIGEILSFYLRPLVPARSIGDLVCNDVAVSAWRGKRTAVDTMDTDDQGMSTRKSRKMLPLPCEATYKNQKGKFIELDGAFGIVQLDRGPRVLISKMRTFANGMKLLPKQFLHDVFKIGDVINFHMKEADADESKGEYDWLALLAWDGNQEPHPDDDGSLKNEMGQVHTGQQSCISVTKQNIDKI